MNQFDNTWGDEDESVRDTTTERIQARIRQAILNGHLEPGVRLKILDIAKRFGTSHMPVREALRQLEGEGLVVIAPHRGAIVRQVDAKFVRNMYEVRATLESLLVGRCATQASKADLDRISTLAEGLEEAGKRGEPLEILEANKRFHKAINAIGDNDVAAQVLDQGWELLSALRLKYGSSPERARRIVEEHRNLIDALCQQKSADAARIAHDHIMGAMDDLLTMMENQNENH